MSVWINFQQRDVAFVQDMHWEQLLRLRKAKVGYKRENVFFFLLQKESLEYLGGGTNMKILTVECVD